ncbi:MAG: Holliday junction resolvase RuvX [Firmicutes bacterium]|jgi:putative Holliday junction resolvase|nr:Holliday junction resolvase RuvX [Bacillota bacterium]
MRIMGLDIGTKTIGVAVSDPLGLTAQGVTVIRRSVWDKDIQALQELADKYCVEKVVIGLPRRSTGELGPEAVRMQAEGNKIEKTLGLPVIYWDEWFTTVSAEQILLEADVSRKRRRQIIDQIAAVIILQNYLDSLESKKPLWADWESED